MAISPVRTSPARPTRPPAAKPPKRTKATAKSKPKPARAQARPPKAAAKPKARAAQAPAAQAKPVQAPAGQAKPVQAPAQGQAKPGQAPAQGGQGAQGAGNPALRALQGIAQPYVDQAKKIAGAATEKFQEGAQALKDKLNPPLDPKQRKAAEYMQRMLETDKLGGNDKTFNHQDVDAIVKGLTDTGFKGTIARRIVAGQLPKGLDEAGVKKDPNAAPDTAPRKISSNELKAFGKAGEALQGDSAMLDKLGLKATFPNGISQDAVTHMLEGKFGLPPGIEIVPAKKW